MGVQKEFKMEEKVTILILIDGFLQYDKTGPHTINMKSQSLF